MSKAYESGIRFYQRNDGHDGIPSLVGGKGDAVVITASYKIMHSGEELGPVLSARGSPFAIPFYCWWKVSLPISVT